jgi:hypothetical protein
VSVSRARPSSGLAVLLLLVLGAAPAAVAQEAQGARLAERTEVVQGSAPTFGAPYAYRFRQTLDEGYWLLTATDADVRQSDDTHTFAVSDGSATQRIVAPDVGDRFVSTATWSRPNDTYRAGEMVQLTLTVRIVEYVWNGTDDGYIHQGLNSVGDGVLARIDVAGLAYGGVTAGAINLTNAGGEHYFGVGADSGTVVAPEAVATVAALFPAGYESGELKDIRVESQSGVARYTYTWVYGEVPTTTTSTTTTTIPDPYIDPSWAEWDEAHPTTTLAPVGPVLIPAGEAPIEGEGQVVGTAVPLHGMLSTGTGDFPAVVFPAVHRRNSDGQWEDLGTYGLHSLGGTELKIGDRLVSGLGGSSFIVYMSPDQSIVDYLPSGREQWYHGREAAVVLSPGAQIRVVQAPNQWLRALGGPESATEGMLQVEHGTVQVRKAPRQDDIAATILDPLSFGVPSFVLPGEYVAQPKGTTFSMSVDGERAELRVFEGEVLVGPSDDAPAAVAVEAGNGVMLDGGQLGIPRPLDVAVAQQEWDGLLPLAVMDEALGNWPTGSAAAGAPLGLIVGIVAGCLLCLGAAVFLVRRRRKATTPPDQGPLPYEPPPPPAP